MTAIGELVLSLVIILVSLVLPIALVLFISMAFASTSGWTSLVTRFPAIEDRPRYKVNFGSATFQGWIGFNGCLRIGSDARGVAVGTNFFLPFGFKSFFIPWSEVEAVIQKKSTFGSVIYQLRIKGAPEIDFALRGRAFHVIKATAAAAGVPAGRW